MCYACNPECGRCKPKRIVAVSCPSCGAPATLRREEHLLLFGLPHRRNMLEERLLRRGGVAAPSCKLCGQGLVEAFRQAVAPAICRRFGIVCGYPCGRNDEDPQPGVAQCPFMVPLGKLENDTSGGADFVAPSLP